MRDPIEIENSIKSVLEEQKENCCQFVKDSKMPASLKKSYISKIMAAKTPTIPSIDPCPVLKIPFINNSLWYGIAIGLIPFLILGAAVLFS